MPLRVVGRIAVSGMAAGLLIGAGVAAATQQSSAESARRVLVAVDFRALMDGRPVLDLRRDEIALRIDGVEQEIRALDLIRLGSSGAPPPFATNLGGRRGRDFILAIDEESFAPGHEAALRDALTALLGEMTPRDRAGLISLHPGGVSIAASASRAALEAAVARVTGRATGPESATDRACRTRRVLPAVASLVRGLNAGVTTSVVMFSAGLSAPSPASVPSRGVESACLLLPSDFDEFRAATARSAAQLYLVHLVESSTGTIDPAAAAGVERLAGEAAGRFLRLTGDSTAPMHAIAEDTAVVYTASVLVPPAARAGTRPVDVRVSRPGVTVRVRTDATLPLLESKTTSPRDMLRTANAFRDLPLRATALASRGSASQARVIVLFESVEPDVALTAAMVGAYDARGQLVTQWTSAREDLGARPALAALMLAPGDYRLRVAAVDALGRSGAVDEELRVDAPPANAVSTSAVVLGALTPGGFAPRLQFTLDDAAAAVYLEVYGVASCSGVSGQLELASSPDGAALVSAPAAAIPIEQAEGCIVRGELALSSLPAADYVVRVAIAATGAPAIRAVRTLRKTAR
jgi:hypothetical protein